MISKPRCSKNVTYYKTLLIGVIVFVIALFLRRQDAFLNPQFWAEDGTVFFKQCYEHGVQSIWMPYAGYYHCVPRIIALASSFICNYKYTPIYYNVVTLMVYLIVIYSIFSKRLNINTRILYSLSLVFVPCCGNEIFMNLTNVQWFMALLLVIVLLKEEPSTIYGNLFLQKIGDLIQVFLTGLTGPFIVLFMPFFFVKAIVIKSFHNWLLTIVALFTSIIQAVTLYKSPCATVNHGTSMRFILSFFEQKVSAPLFFGWVKYYEQISLFYILIYIYIILYLIFLICKSKCIYGIFFITLHFLFISAALFRIKGDLAIFGTANGNRYLFIPYVMLSWAILTVLKNGKTNYFLYSLLFLILTSSLSSGFRSQFVNYNWNYYSAKIGKEEVDVPINPPGWTVSLHANPDTKKLINK